MKISVAKKLFSAGLLLVLVFFALHFLFPIKTHISFATVVEDKDGNVIHAFLSADEKWRMNAEKEEISTILKKTLIYKEDKYFYYHFGINPIAIVRASFMNIIKRKRTSGASTITMQVARLLNPKQRTYANKIVEMFRAMQLEWMLSKDEILELYFKLVPYGSNVEGIKSASIIYLQKSPDFLTLAEATALSIIPNRPSSLVPGKHNAKIETERNKWLMRFKKDGLFSEKEIDDALSEPFEGKRHDAPKKAPHFSIRMKNSSSEPIIKTQLNIKLQTEIEAIVSQYIKAIYLQGIKNASAIVIDNSTKKVVAYIGSADFSNKEDGGQVDGVKAVRQPGSTLKPLLYGVCIDNGLITPKTIVTDVLTDIGGYRPENYDKKFNGNVTIEYSLMNSLNIPAVKMLQLLGKEKMVEKMVACNFQQINKDREKLGLSLILGGCGVTLEELTGLFSIFANNGNYQQPLYLKHDSLATIRSILSEESTYMITEILSKIQRPDMPSSWEAGRNAPRIAWKTGTSYGRRDAWSIGYNKKYTVGVWVGNFSGIGAPDINGAQVATPLLFNIFNKIDPTPENEWFQIPENCKPRLVCSETGLIPNDYCESTVMDYFIPLVSSMKQCSHMKEVVLSADESFSYCMNCMPPLGYKKKFFKVIAPEMQSHYESHGIAYQRIPPHNAQCETMFEAGSPKITSPINGLEYLIDKNYPQPIQLSCDVANDVEQVYWYINNKFYKAAPAKSKLFFTPEAGKIKISCTDDKGRNTDIRIEVRYVRI
jgi:penicillin-binding protein 1C